METKQSVFIATSFDGFIARPNDELDWLIGDGSQSGEETEGPYGFKEFMDSVDALVMGRNTFEVVLTLGEWHYGDKKVFVLTSNKNSVDIPDRLTDKVELMSGSPQEIVDQLAEKNLNHLYVDGGKTIQKFLQAGLIQEMTLTRVPILIGEGIPLFGPLEKDIKLEHISTVPFENGFVQSKYRLIHDG